ncbi:MAG: glycosyltransferase, partial [Methylocystaceae bacterium]
MHKYLRSIYQQVFRFGITGLVNTAIDFILFNLLIIGTGFNSPGQVAIINAISVTVAACNSYLMNRYWTFAARNPVARMHVGRFVIATAIGMIINTTVVTGIGYLTTWLPLSTYLLLNISKLGGAVLSASWNFVVYRSWVFVDWLPVSDKCEIQAASTAGLTSIIIPAYNEGARLPVRLRQLIPWLREGSLELIIVDDGSQDDTFQVAASYAAVHPGCLRVIRHPVNRGKGAAVQSGMAAARGEFLIFSDADTTFSPDHLKEIGHYLKLGHNLVIGCRQGRAGERLAGESKLRQIMGRGFNLLVQGLVLPGIVDSQCGLKGFSRSAAVSLFSRQRVPGFAFDVEILALAQRLGYAIKVVEVEAAECEGSSVKCWRAALNMGLELLHIRWRLSFNYYGLPRPASGFSWALAGGLFVTALAVRLPWLWEVPRYIDELSEVNLAYQIYLGNTLPLTNMAHDIGSLHNYILAAIFKLLGPSIYWPRLYMAVTSALTVVIVCAIGRRLFNRTVGLLAAGLLLTNGMHIVVTHMAWSNSSTSFFFTLALLTLLIAEERASGLWLLLSSLLWAATLQTHSSAIIYVLAVAIYLISQRLSRRSLINWHWYLAGIGVFLTGYANMIYYNVTSRGGSFIWVGHKTYALESNPSLAAYLHNTTQMGIELLRSLGSIYVNPISGNFWWPTLWLLTVLGVLILGLFRGVQAGK